MSDDWVKKYSRLHDQREQKRQNDQRKANLAEEAAPEAFRRIRGRVKRDLAALHKEEKFLQVEIFGDASALNFEVRVSGSPSAELRVELKHVFIHYTHSFLSEGKIDPIPGTLRIDVSPDGETRTYKNGDAFAHDAEVSEFLLGQLLTHVLHNK